MIWLYSFIAILALILIVSLLLTRLWDRSLKRSYPSSGEVTRVSGGSVHWTVSGEGPTVILVHGLAGNMHNFSAMEKRLAQHYKVYCLDRPGSGHSSRRLSTDASFDNQAKMLIEWMNKQHIDSALFVGHSMGGAISLNIAIQAPEKVKGLALIAPLTAPLNIKPSLFARWYFRSPKLRYVVARGFSPLINRKIGRKQVNIIFKPEPPTPDFGYRYGGALSMLSTAFLAASGDLASAQRSLKQQMKYYDKITCPVGVLYGDGDRVLSCSEHTSAIKQALPNADIRILENRGHMLPITTVDECIELIDDIQAKTINKPDKD
ncbi:alpha/beta fold hydrolase [Alteromonas facilis]|uniref:alpha/beta fold hydrolase n=1 Tax=Alteromonas facilis TaxID=2048004 RepID=UPI000C28FF11|nr:alpha/beta fold hydrolase [Alteromonas facilis]